MDHQTNALIVELETQRNAALTDSAQKAGLLGIAYNEIKELRGKIEVLEKEIETLQSDSDGTDQSDN